MSGRVVGRVVRGREFRFAWVTSEGRGAGFGIMRVLEEEEQGGGLGGREGGLRRRRELGVERERE